jgi:polysaccharide export outer membrane protein
VVTLKFPLAPEFDQVLLPVMPDGFVSLRGVGDVWLAGKTLPEVRAAVESAYSELLRNPEVTVTLDQFQKPYFVAFGQVTNPGKYDLVGELTATQALGIAGGFAERAKRRQLVVLRARDGAWAEVLTVDVRSLLRDGQLTEDVFLRPGDMLFVPTNPIGNLQQYIPRLGYGF